MVRVAPARGRCGALLWALAAAAPVAAAVVLAVRYFLPLPLYDYWHVVYASYRIPPGLRHFLVFLWVHFVDQRMVLPKGLIYALTRLTANRHYPLEIALGFLLQAGAAWLCLRALRGVPGLPVAARRLGTLFVTAFLFWPALDLRFQNPWYSTQYGLVLFFGLAALYLLGRRAGTWRAALGGLAAALAGAYTHGTGAALMPVLTLLLLGDRRWRAGQRVLWVAATTLCLATILTGRPPPDRFGFLSPAEGVRHPLHLAAFACRALALPSGRAAAGAALAGLVLGSLALLGRAALRPPFFFWWGTLLWCGAVAGATALGRYPARVPAPQYGCFFTLFYLTAAVWALAAGAGPAAGRRTLARGVGVVALGTFAALYFEAAAAGIRRARRRHRAVSYAAAKLRFLPLMVPADTEVLFPRYPRLCREVLPFLARRGLLRGLADLRPLTRPVANRFTLTAARGVGEVVREREGVRVELVRPRATLVFRPARPFRREAALALHFAAPPQVEGRLFWDDGRGYAGRRSQALRRRPVGGSYWFLFVDPRRPPAVGRVREIKMELWARALPAAVRLGRFRLWRHGEVVLKGPAEVRPGGTVSLRLRIPSEAGRPYVAAAAWRRGRGELPLVRDGLFFLSLRAAALFPGFRGMLREDGSELRVRVPAVAALAGRRFYVAAATVGPAGLRAVSRPHAVWIRGGEK